jgi:hypothetical protein
MMKNIPLIFTLAFIFFAAAHAEQGSQSHESIDEAVKSYIAKKYKHAWRI